MGVQVKKWFLGLLWLCCLSNFALAQHYLEFTENKGQWDKSILYKADVPNGSFLLGRNSYRIILHEAETYANLQHRFHRHALATQAAENGGGRADFPEEEVLRSHAFEVKFLGANPNPTLVPDKVLPAFSNYFLGNDSSQWAAGCRSFQAVLYQNIYPHTDVRFYAQDQQLKYDIILRPGADINKVVLYAEGLEGLKLKEGNLQFQTTVGTLTESIPLSYALGAAGKTNVPVNYQVKGNFIRYQSPQKQAPGETWVIDPQITFISFSGSTADNWGFTSTYDLEGNFYAGGIVFADGFPVTNGAFQRSFAGGVAGNGLTGYDIGIEKFSPDGTRLLYATYLGGSSNEQPHSMYVDQGGNLVVAGRTLSGSSFPAAGTLSLLGVGGKYDIFLTKFNATGSRLLASLRIGGSEDDGVNVSPNYTSLARETTKRNYGDDARSEVLVDDAGNIILASVTQSTNFPASSNAFQRTNGGVATAGARFQDGVIIKLNNAMNNVVFSSFLGGNRDDAAFVLAVRPGSGDIYVAGATASSNFPGNANNPGAFRGFKGGEIDGFIAVISADGQILQQSAMVGTDGNDVVYGIQFDRQGFPYVTGTTTGFFPVVNSPYNQADTTQNRGKHFISKLQPDLSAYVFSANFGKSNLSIPSLSLVAFLVDRCGNMYVSGWGGANLSGTYTMASIRELPLSADAYDRSTDGADFYFFVLKQDATALLYATYFGQNGGYPDHVDGGTSRFDAKGEIYQSICSCRRDLAINEVLVGTPGAFSPFNASNGRCNLLAVKLRFDLAGVGSDIASSINGVKEDSVGCVPLRVNFNDTIANATTYYWDFDGDGTNDLTTTTPYAQFLYNTVGTFRARLISEDLSSCNQRDTSYKTILVRNNAVTNLDFSFAVVGNCVNRTFQFTNLAVPPAGGSFGPQSFVWDYGDGSKPDTTGAGPITHQFPAEGTYKVRLTLLDQQFCNESDFVEKNLRIALSLQPAFVADTACLGSATQFTYTGRGGATYVWDFGDGTTSTAENPQHTYTRSGTFTVNLTVTDPNVCDPIKTQSISAQVLVSPIPVSALDFSPRSSAPNTLYTFTNLSTGATNYQWDFGDGSRLNTVRVDTLVQHAFPATGTYDVCLFAINAAGCIAKTCTSVDAVVNPLFDVPNAFSPNGDGVNDRIFVRGFGIAKMSWKIYNRWGQLVFFSTDPAQGWDGRFQGKLQPQEVYHYTLEIEFSDKVKQVRKGDITLLR